MRRTVSRRASDTSRFESWNWHRNGEQSGAVERARLGNCITHSALLVNVVGSLFRTPRPAAVNRLRWCPPRVKSEVTCFAAGETRGRWYPRRLPRFSNRHITVDRYDRWFAFSSCFRQPRTRRRFRRKTPLSPVPFLHVILHKRAFPCNATSLPSLVCHRFLCPWLFLSARHCDISLNLLCAVFSWNITSHGIILKTYIKIDRKTYLWKYGSSSPLLKMIKNDELKNSNVILN